MPNWITERDGGGLALAILAVAATSCGHGSTAPSAADEFDPPGPAPAATVVVAGDRQTRLPGTALIGTLSARAVDSTGAPLERSGLEVSWSVASGGGRVTGVSFTDSEGVALADWTLGPTLGEQTVRVAIGGTQPVTFTARAVEPGPILFARETRESIPLPWHLFVMNADGGDVVQLTNEPFRDRDSDWSPDGSSIVFERLRVIERETHILRLSLTDLVESFFPYQNSDAGSFVWSPDGSELAFSVKQDTGCARAEHNIWLVNADGSNPTKITTSPCSKANRFPDWSPDGSKLVYESEEGLVCCTEAAIWVMNGDGTNRVRVSTTLGYHAHWHPDGRRIVVGGIADNGSGALLRVLDTGTGVEDTLWTAQGFDYVMPGGVSPDGRFAVAEVAPPGRDSDVYRIDLQTGEVVNLTPGNPNDFDGFPSWRR